MADFKGDANPKRQAEGILRIDKINKELAELYIKFYKLANGVEVAGTYLDMGVSKNDILKFYGSAR